MWNEPCGDVSYAEAVVKVAKWTAEHDALINQLDDPESAKKVRLSTEAQAMLPKVDFLITAHNAGELPDEFDPLEAAKAGLKAADSNPLLDDQDRLVRYLAILDTSFGKHIPPPVNLDERDDFDLVKKKLERRIAALARTRTCNGSSGRKDGLRSSTPRG